MLYIFNLLSFLLLIRHIPSTKPSLALSVLEKNKSDLYKIVVTIDVSNLIMQILCGKFTIVFFIIFKFEGFLVTLI